ncbi:MAG: response regulator [Chroococcidiopsidaceae cyanobacterium CP_BM_ER_R8_30]|nr:response regulator [Chroococcidiopsidaceae cyanobacterium CP_BM_ER_R8_30]
MSDETMAQGTILIVDDTPANLKILFDFLADFGFRVLVAQDGESAILKSKYALPDLILLDVLMPGIDGFETCYALKADAATQDIPIIFMTALSEPVDKVKGLNLGAVDYITKPLEPEEVLARVKLHLNLRRLTKKLQQQNQRLEHELEERQRSEQKIREQAALLDIATDAILVLDLDSWICFWNKGAERLYGWQAEEVIGQKADELLYRQTLSELQPLPSFCQTGEWQGELHQVTKEGKEIVVASRWTLVCDEDGQPKSILTVNTDITQKKQLEVQFLRVQRLESIGTLASGIAHDLNNILTPVLASAQLLQKTQLNNEKQQLLLTALEASAKRGTALIKQVLSFARGMEGSRTILQVRHLIEEIRHIVQETFPKSIELYMDILPNLWTVYADATQLHQVLMNLVVNAHDAMPHGGTLTLSAENLFIDENYARIHSDASAGPYIVITVADTGIGMPPEILDRIFEPFFTTKEPGQGTGLGLSTVFGIIKSHDGFVNVYSEVGRGTRFQVCLPAIEESDLRQAQNIDVPLGNEELILVVDDEVLINEITKTTLETYNYRALTASNGIEAISIYAEQQAEIRLVLLDMMMPELDSSTTIRTLQTLNPLCKIIAFSGLASNQKLAYVHGPCVKAFLSKPYTTSELLNTIKTVLNMN